MARKTYTTQVRVLLCDYCGAPLEIAAQGGIVACSYCRAQNEIERRSRPIVAPPSAPIDENERIHRLRLQDGQPFVPPASLQPLIGPGGFLPAKVDEAFHVYQATRREIDATHSPEAAERLFALTLIANNHLTNTGDERRRRALLETSLETLSLPRHVQVIRCLLASASAKEGDVRSAEEWLAPCNPRSDDIDADSAFRVARAFVDTVRGDFAAVHSCLGGQDDGYPIADTWDPTCAVLRANALERLGDVQGAVAALSARMSKEDARGRMAMESVIRAHPQLALCTQSFPLASQAHAQVAAKRAHVQSGGSIGTIFMVVGLGVCLFGVVLAISIGAPMALFTANGPAELFPAALSAGITFLTTLPIGLVFFFVGRAFRNKGKRAARLRAHGLQVQGRLRGMRPTGTRINEVPMMRVEVEVLHPSGAYVASFEQLLDGPLIGLQPGALVPLRVDPQNPREILLEST